MRMKPGIISSQDESIKFKKAYENNQSFRQFLRQIEAIPAFQNNTMV